MKKLLLILLLFPFIILAQVNSNTVKVKGYYKKDGTYVAPYTRTAPNSTNRDNYSTKGNVNPYTGKHGYIDPDNSISTTGSYNYNTKITPTMRYIDSSINSSIGKFSFIFDKVEICKWNESNKEYINCRNNNKYAGIIWLENNKQISCAGPAGKITYNIIQSESLADGVIMFNCKDDKDGDAMFVVDYSRDEINMSGINSNGEIYLIKHFIKNYF